MELIVEKAEFVALCHFVRSTFPRKSLIVERLLICPNVDWLPVLKWSDPLSNVVHVHAWLDCSIRPFLKTMSEAQLCLPYVCFNKVSFLKDIEFRFTYHCFRYFMTLRTHSLVERDNNVGVEERHELGLVLWQAVVGGDLEYRVDEDAGQRPPQLLVVSPDHRQEVADQIGTESYNS